MKINWHYIKPFVGRVALVLDEKTFNKEIKNTKYPYSLHTGVACVHTLDKDKNERGRRYVVSVDLKTTKLLKYSTHEIYSLLVHESFHVVEGVRKYVEEDKFGEETSAYLLENVFLFLLNEYVKQTKGRK